MGGAERSRLNTMGARAGGAPVRVALRKASGFRSGARRTRRAARVGRRERERRRPKGLQRAPQWVCRAARALVLSHLVMRRDPHGE